MEWRKDKKAGTRRVPRQARSQKRYEVILDAAAELFAESGFETTTMEAIAARAGTSIGSLYQFFSNKHAIFRALAERSLDRSRNLFEQMPPQELLERPWTELLDAIIDSFAAFEYADSGFRAIWTNLHLYGEYAEADKALYDMLVDRTRDVLAGRIPHVSEEQREVIATMVVEIVAGSLFLSSRRESSLAGKMLEETKVLLRRYLEPYFRATKTSHDET